MPETRLRLAAIDFLNPAPLMWNFEHEPERSRLAERYAIGYSTPSQCAESLASGQADIGLVPTAAFARNPSMLIVPGCAIASKGRIRSILLVTREGGPEACRSVAMDTSSLTSATYTKILFRKFWNSEAEFLPSAPDLEAMLASADAALLIGDPALLALEDSQPRFDRTGETLLYLDLGHEWGSRTGLPWVSAFWGVRAAALDETPVSREALTADFIASRNQGLGHIEDLVAEWGQRIALPEQLIRTYLTENIHYLLDHACMEGLRAFYRYAAEFEILPSAPEIQLL